VVQRRDITESKTRWRNSPYKRRCNRSVFAVRKDKRMNMNKKRIGILELEQIKGEKGIIK